MTRRSGSASGGNIASLPITYRYDPGRRLLETTVSGDVGLVDVDEYFKKVRLEPWFPPPALTDVRKASPSLPGAEVRAIAELLRRLGPELKRAPLAVLVDSDVAFGLVRMIGLLLDDVVNVRPFRGPAAALTWLEQERP